VAKQNNFPTFICTTAYGLGKIGMTDKEVASYPLLGISIIWWEQFLANRPKKVRYGR
jgi:hypothetical protein